MFFAVNSWLVRPRRRPLIMTCCVELTLVFPVAFSLTLPSLPFATFFVGLRASLVMPTFSSILQS